MVKTMDKSKNFLHDDAIKSVEEAIAHAEKDTLGEIVVAVARVSGKYDRAEDIFGLLLAIGILAVVWKHFAMPIDPHSFDNVTYSLGILPIIALIIVSFIAGSALATYVPILKIPFIPKNEAHEEVNRSAAECFYHYGIGKTINATGILLYISLYERIVVIKGDSAISKKVSQNSWNIVCREIIDGLKQKKADKGLVAAINQCGILLKEHFPSSGQNINELPNRIYFID
jgi:putative membrane protein